MHGHPRDRKSGQDRLAVLAAVIVDLLAERSMEAGEPGEVGRFVNRAAPAAVAVYLLKSDEVRPAA